MLGKPRSNGPGSGSQGWLPPTAPTCLSSAPVPHEPGEVYAFYVHDATSPVDWDVVVCVVLLWIQSAVEG